MPVLSGSASPPSSAKTIWSRPWVLSSDSTRPCMRTNRSISRSAPSTGWENPGKILLELIEVQTGSYLGEDEIIRIEDDYRRSYPPDRHAHRPLRLRIDPSKANAQPAVIFENELNARGLQRAAHRC
jgi:Mannose-6-phosphate isomerase